MVAITENIQLKRVDIKTVAESLGVIVISTQKKDVEAHPKAPMV